MLSFGKVECAYCKKTGKKNEFIFDEASRNYYCCEDHREKSYQLGALIRQAHSKGLKLCTNCLKEIKNDAFACKYCGTVFINFGEYEIQKMCPFTVMNIGSDGNYTWKHGKCLQEYCALFDMQNDRCGFASKIS